MTVPLPVAEAIARAVTHQGGTREDVDDLVWTWERLHASTGPRVDAMRREAATRRCACADVGVADEDGRCERCYGLIREAAR